MSIVLRKRDLGFEVFKGLDFIGIISKEGVLTFDACFIQYCTLTIDELNSIIQIFSTKFNLNNIDKTSKLPVLLIEKPKEVVTLPQPTIIGKKFVITGKIPGYTRSDIEKLIIYKGGIVQKSVDKTTNYLVVADTPGNKETKKIKDAELYGTHIMNHHAFLRILT